LSKLYTFYPTRGLQGHPMESSGSATVNIVYSVPDALLRNFRLALKQTENTAVIVCNIVTWSSALF